MNTFTPPAYNERYEYRGCKQMNDPVTRKRVYLTPDGEKLPSVTTVLSHTKDMTHLNEWKNRVGHDNAKRIANEAAGVGTAMHNNLERFVCGIERMPGKAPIHVKANAMANQIIINGLKDVNEIWGIEQSLYFPGLYSGTTDLVGEYKGKGAIMDFKQSNRPKKAEWVDDYRMQIVAYGLAHNEVYGTDISEGHIFVCTRGDDGLMVGGEIYQQFDVWPDEWHKYEDMWLDKVEEYYLNKNI